MPCGHCRPVSLFNSPVTSPPQDVVLRSVQSIVAVPQDRSFDFLGRCFLFSNLDCAILYKVATSYMDVLIQYGFVYVCDRVTLSASYFCTAVYDNYTWKCTTRYLPSYVNHNSTIHTDWLICKTRGTNR